MPHTTLREFSRATGAFRSILKFCNEMTKQLGMTRSMRTLLEESTFTLTQQDNEWYYEIDFSPLVRPDAPSFMQLAAIFIKQTGSIAKVTEHGLTTEHIWTNENFNIKATFTHKSPAFDGTPETIEDSKDGTGQATFKRPVKKATKKTGEVT